MITIGEMQISGMLTMLVLSVMLVMAGLVATLRIEEAQRVLIEHRDWSVESVADYCGFNDRKYFHQVFQQLTGTTPAKYQQAHS